MSENYLLSAGQIFTLFFVMLGPLKLLGPYAKATHTLTLEQLRSVSITAAGLSLVSLLVGGYLGKFLLDNWGIPVSVLELTSGIIFFLMALLMILIPRKEEHPAKDTPEPEVKPTSVAFSMIVSPYGMAAVVGLLTVSASTQRTLLILGMLVFILILDLLAMIYIRHIMGKTGVLIMQIVGSTFAVLQASLGLHMIFLSIKLLKNDLPL